MPCLIITGYPCSGKSELAETIRDVALRHFGSPTDGEEESGGAGATSALIGSVVIVGDAAAAAAAGPDQDASAAAACYADPAAEKAARGRLKSEFDRAVNSSNVNSGGGKNSGATDGGGNQARGGKKNSSSNNNQQLPQLVIVDSLNYIKGYRYELHCISRAAGERHGVVWALSTADQARRRNRRRREEEAAAGPYDDSLLEELIRRYEPPDARNRWDSPLYTIDLRLEPEASAAAAEGEEGEAAAANEAAKDGAAPAEAALEAARNSVYDMHRLRSALGQRAADDEASARTATPSSQAGSASSAPFLASATSATATKAPTVLAGGGGGGGGTRKRAVFKRPSRPQGPPASGAAAAQEGAAPVADAAGAMSASVGGPETTTTANTSADSSSTSVAGVQTRGVDSDTSEAPAQTAAATTSEGQQRQKQRVERQVLEMLRSFLSDANQPLKAGTSTARRDASDPDALHRLDSVTQQVCRAVLAAAAGSGPAQNTIPQPCSFSLYGETFTFSPEKWGGAGKKPTPATLSDELPRLRRQYMHWVATYPPENVGGRKSGNASAAVARSFLEYLDAQL